MRGHNCTMVGFILFGFVFRKFIHFRVQVLTCLLLSDLHIRCGSCRCNEEELSTEVVFMLISVLLFQHLHVVFHAVKTFYTKPFWICFSFH